MRRRTQQLAFSAALGACALATSACYVRIQSAGGASGGSSSASSGLLNPAELRASQERRVRRTLPLAPGERFRLALPLGEIHVVSADEQARLELEIRARARDEAAARAALDSLRCVVAREEGGARAAIEHTREGEHARARATLTVVALAFVPAGTALDLQAGHASIRAEGRFGAVVARSDFGSIELAGADGGVDARTKSGSITLRDASGGDIAVRSDFGKLSLARIDARSVDARTSSGAIELRAIDAALRARTAFGRIDAARLRGSASLHTQSGAIDVRALRAPLVAHTDFGSVKIEGSAPRIRASSNSGSVHAEFAGRGAALDELTLESDFGSVTFVAPPDLDATLHASSGFGEVRSDFDAGSAPSARGEIRGQIGGGRAALRLRSASGAVRLRRR